MATIEERVAAGVKLLDEKRPGWRSEVSAELLSMVQKSQCVLGQIFGWYDDGRAQLGLGYITAPDYGFTSDYRNYEQFEGLDEKIKAENEEFAALTEAWRQQLIVS
jgi:hypothetical protein